MERINKKADYWSIILLFVFSIVFVFFNSKNSPLYLFNEWGDVNIYFTIGKGIANGLTPYKDLFDHKGPFIFFIYSIAYLLSNTSFTGVYILECIALFINILFAFKMAKLYLNRNFSLIVAFIYAVFLFNKSYYGGSAEEFISVFITIGLYYFILFFREENHSKRNRQIMIQGIVFTLTFLSKLSICSFWIPILAAIFIQLLIKKQYKLIITHTIYFLIGVAITLLPFIIYFAYNNALQDAYWGYIQFNSLYAEFKPNIETIRKTGGHFFKLLRYDYITFPITLLGVFMLSFTKKYVSSIYYRIGILLSFLLSFAIICLSKYIMTYAHIVIYAYAIFGLIFIFQLISRFIKGKSQVVAVIATFFIALAIGINTKNFFYQDSDCLLRKKECNYMQKEFADIINKEKNPTLLNIGLDLGVYTKTGIIPTYKYFFYPNIPYQIFPEIRDYQMGLIKQKKPMFIVIGDKSAYYDEYKNLPALNENYKLMATYNQNSTEYDKQVFLYKKR